MNYLSEIITVVSTILSVLLSLAGLLGLIPKKVNKYFFFTAVAFLIVAYIAGIYTIRLYGWDM